MFSSPTGYMYDLLIFLYWFEAYSIEPPQIADKFPEVLNFNQLIFETQLVHRFISSFNELNRFTGSLMHTA